MGEAYLDWQKKSGGIKLNDVIEEYRYVAAGKQIKAGDLVNYINGVAGKTDYGESVDTQLLANANAGKVISAIKLDDKRVFIAHNNSNSHVLYGIVCTIDGATITYGENTAIVTSTESGTSISACLLPNGNVFIAHWGDGSNRYLYGIVCMINGATITCGTDTAIVSTAYAGYTISTCLLPNGNVFIAHSYSSSYNLYGIVVSINGTTITAGPDTALATSSSTGNKISTCLLPNGNVFIAHSYGSSNYLYGIVCSISGTTITKGSDTKIEGVSNSGYAISTCLLPNGNVFIAHSYDTAHKLHMVVVSISGTAISVESGYINGAYKGQIISVVALNNNNVLVTHHSTNTDYYLYGLLVTVDGTVITCGVDTQLNNTSYSGVTISSLLLDNGTIFTAHANSTNYYLNAQIFGIDYENNIPTNHIVITEYEQQVTPATEPPFNAVALSSGIGGTDTEHNEQVKIAFMAGLKTVDGKFIVGNGEKLIIPKGGN